MIIQEEDYLAHYGILRKSGRYPWGSGGNESEPQHKNFLDHVKTLQDSGMNEKEVADALNIKITELRNLKSVAKNDLKREQIKEAEKLKAKGYSNVAIGKALGIPESSVRVLLAPGEKEKADILENLSNILKDQVDSKKYIDIGKGVEYQLNTTDTTLKNAVAKLKDQGYTVHKVKVTQLGTGKETTILVLAGPGVTAKEVFQNRFDIKQIDQYSDDGGRTNYGILPPLSIDPSRVGVRYAEDGGTKADGVIYVRPGVEDVSLGGKSYAQVRVKVGDRHFLKGMAMYKNDLPEGTDLLFNTNKSNTGVKTDAMKELKDDPDNPFGSVIERQIGVTSPDGKVHKLTSVMNIVNEEGTWWNWSRSVSPQVLSKQDPKLAKEQLDMTYEQRVNEFERISSLTNPTVRKKLLEAFGDECDSAAVHLKAAQFPRQYTHVILPVESISPKQIYAPNYENGSRVVLIRYPHGGIFEIPELVVNNNHKESKATLKDAKDAVGINPKVAEILSGADFDGDTVLVIPNNNPSKKIKTQPPLEGLKDFDPKTKYRYYEGMKVLPETMVQREMGDISNLITDMTIKGASNEKLVRAVRHSMVVIDANKHKLDYQQSAIDNGIKQLKEEYQGSPRGGASTLISRAKRQASVPQRKDSSRIDPATGKRVYSLTNESYVDKKGRVVYKISKSTELAETEDAFTLSSGTRIESVYAQHSNKLKALANRARMDSVNTPRAPWNPSAKRTYEAEVRSLDAKLALAKRNSPYERQAQLVANAIVKAKREADPGMDKVTLKKIKGQALNEARNRTGAKKTQVVITPREWEAIQAGAISDTKLSDILDNADMDVVKELASPKTKVLMTSAKTKRAQSMLNLGYTRAEVAAQLGVSLSTLDASTDVKDVANAS